jgi:hypothetical protein
MTALAAAAVVRCAWCQTELAPQDAKPVKYARLRSAPDADNTQCRDLIGCQQRQDLIDAQLDARLRTAGLAFLCRRAS